MQPSTPSAWGLLTALHWIAAVIGFAPTVVFVTFTVYGWIGSGLSLSANVWPYALAGLIVVGLLVATFWPGIGEVVGGLALIGGAYWLTASSFWVGASIIGGVMYGVAGLLFIVCSWDTLARWQSYPTRTTA